MYDSKFWDIQSKLSIKGQSIKVMIKLGDQSKDRREMRKSMQMKKKNHVRYVKLMYSLEPNSSCIANQRPGSASYIGCYST